MRSVSVDGSYPTVEVLTRRATVNYGHFTSMQVRNGGVKGLDLHLARLCAASKELSDAELDPQRVRSYLRAAVRGSGDVSARIDVFPEISGADEHIMVTISEPETAHAAPLTLKSATYQRPVPQIKHAGGFAQLFHQKQARKAGFGDALLVGNGDEISETAVANIGFIRDGVITWPSADALYGIAWQILDAIIAREEMPCSRRPLHLQDLPAFETAFTTDSHGITPVSRINEIMFPVGSETLYKLTALFDAEPLQPI